MLSRLLGGALLSVLLLANSSPGAISAQPSPHCQPGQQPQFVFGFKSLQEQLGERMGEPVECEHANPENGDTLQKTSTGLAFYRKSTNTPTFTNGWEHWALTEAGLVYWTGESIDPPGFAAQMEATDATVDQAPIEILSTDGGLRLLIGPQALPEGVSAADIRISRVDASGLLPSEASGGSVVGYQLEPDGLQFKEPISLTLRMPMGAAGAVPALFQTSDGGEQVELLNDTRVDFDLATGEVALLAEIDHFSLYFGENRGLFSLTLAPLPRTVQVGDSFEFVMTIQPTRRAVLGPLETYLDRFQGRPTGITRLNGRATQYSYASGTPYRVENRVPANSIVVDGRTLEPSRVGLRSAFLLEHQAYEVAQTFTCVQPGYAAIRSDERIEVRVTLEKQPLFDDGLRDRQVFPGDSYAYNGAPSGPAEQQDHTVWLDFLHSLTCEAPPATPEPTPGVDVRTPTPTSPPPTPAPTATETRVSLGAEVGPGQVLVFRLDGVDFLTDGLEVIPAHPPFCEYEHVHGPPVRSLLPGLDGTYRTISEYLGECGYGPPNFYLISDPR